jgi:hypothetical protein
MNAVVDTTFGKLNEWRYSQSMREKIRHRYASHGLRFAEKNIPHVVVASTGNVNSLMSASKDTPSMPSTVGRLATSFPVREFMAIICGGVRVPINSLCVFFVEGPVAIPLATD